MLWFCLDLGGWHSQEVLLDIYLFDYLLKNPLPLVRPVISLFLPPRATGAEDGDTATKLKGLLVVLCMVLVLVLMLAVAVVLVLLNLHQSRGSLTRLFLAANNSLRS